MYIVCSYFFSQLDSLFRFFSCLFTKILVNPDQFSHFQDLITLIQIQNMIHLLKMLANSKTFHKLGLHFAGNIVF